VNSWQFIRKCRSISWWQQPIRLCCLNYRIQFAILKFPIRFFYYHWISVHMVIKRFRIFEPLRFYFIVGYISIYLYYFILFLNAHYGLKEVLSIIWLKFWKDAKFVYIDFNLVISRIKKQLFITLFAFISQFNGNMIWKFPPFNFYHPWQKFNSLHL
jgi:hypothetical protein